MFTTKGWTISQLVEFNRHKLKKMGISSADSRMIMGVSRDWNVLLSTSPFLSENDKTLVVSKLESSGLSFGTVQKMGWMELQKFTSFNYVLTTQLKAALEYGLYPLASASTDNKRDVITKACVEPSPRRPEKGAAQLQQQLNGHIRDRVLETANVASTGGHTGKTSAHLQRQRDLIQREGNDEPAKHRDSNRAIDDDESIDPRERRIAMDSDDDNGIRKGVESSFSDAKLAVEAFCTTPTKSSLSMFPDPLQFLEASNETFLRRGLSMASGPPGALLVPLVGENVPAFTAFNNFPKTSSKPKKARPITMKTQAPFLNRLLDNVKNVYRKTQSKFNPSDYAQYLGPCINAYLLRIQVAAKQSRGRNAAISFIGSQDEALTKSLLQGTPLQWQSTDKMMDSLAIRILDELVKNVNVAMEDTYKEVTKWYERGFPPYRFATSTQARVLVQVFQEMQPIAEAQEMYRFSSFYWTTLIKIFQCFLFRDNSIEPILPQTKKRLAISLLGRRCIYTQYRFVIDLSESGDESDQDRKPMAKRKREDVAPGDIDQSDRNLEPEAK
jgi:hypothetical protein